ncbi:MAG: DNA-binding protein [bacterium]
MRRDDLRRLSRLRIREARILLRAGAVQGAYYLGGYAVECALKACVAQQFRQHDIPDRKLVNDVYTHDMDKLLDLEGLRPTLQQHAAMHPLLQTNWNVVKDWKETARYNPRVTAQEAQDLYSACTARRYGILAWLRNQW